MTRNILVISLISLWGVHNSLVVRHGFVSKRIVPPISNRLKFQHIQQIPSSDPRNRQRYDGNLILSVTSNNKEEIDNDGKTITTYSPLFDFSNVDKKAIDKFDRIDDAIMGGISLSSMKQLPEESFVRWSGICRVDGGGFCGTRTLPFEEPLQVGENSKGFYLLCKFTSDDEPGRRIWKMTTRDERSRGEQLYQAMFEIPKPTIIEGEGEEDSWCRVLIPFSSFQLVRGPRLIEGGPALNTTGGLFQIGMTLSKFQMSSSPLELEDFRPGFFELQIKEIGIYSQCDAGENNNASDTQDELLIDTPKTLSKEAMEKQRPFVAKVFFPVAKMLFSEKRRRRNSALRILQKRGLTRFRAILFGFQRKASSKGTLLALFQTFCLLSGDMLRASISLILRFAVFYPLIASFKVINFCKKNLFRGKTAIDEQ